MQKIIECGENSETNLSIKIYRSIAEVNADQWDAIVDKDCIFCTYRYVEALEKSGFNENRCYYLAIYDGDEIIAHASAYLMSAELDLFAGEFVKKITNLVRRKWKDFLVLRSIECGPPIALGNALSFKDGVDRAQALQLICQGIEGLAKELGMRFILFRDFYDHDMKFFDLLKERGYMKIHNLPNTNIKIKWKSFDEYLDSMRSNYRRKIIKRMDACAKANISIEVMKNLSDHTHELKRLYDNVYDQAKEYKRERLSGAFFQNIGKYFGGKAIILSAMKEGKLIGYMFLFISGKTMISAFPGLDYDYNKEHCIYFNLFYKSIELAIETGMDEIDTGITTLNPKRDMGCNVGTLNMYMRHSNPFLNKILPLLFDMITKPDTSKPRNVFKENYTD